MLSSLRNFLALAAFFLALIGTTSLAQPAKPVTDDPELRRAYKLVEEGKYVDAMPLFEKLAAEHPTDSVIREKWAWCLYEFSATVFDAKQRQAMVARARTIALQAKDLGDNNQMVQLLLDLPVDVSERAYSDRKAVDDIIQAAEAEFVVGDVDKARMGYLRADALAAFYPVENYDDFVRWFESVRPLEADLGTFRPLLALHIDGLKAQNVVYTEIMIEARFLPRDKSELIGRFRAFREWVTEQENGETQVEFLVVFGRNRTPEEAER